MSESYPERVVSIKVIGVGGAGNNVVNSMVEAGVQGVEFVSVNTDRQDLNRSSAPTKVQIGEKLTGGMGAGSKPEVGRKSAEESRDAIAKLMEGTDMVFITAGMGGGTGTGAAPIIADIARESGALTVGVVTKPFRFEGKRRMEQAEDGIAALSNKVDSLIIIPNDRLKYVTNEKITFANAFGIADGVLKQAVTSISELVGYSENVCMNLDFADVSSVMRDAGRAHMGVGIASGKDKAETAAMQAVSSPLLETSIDGAMGVLVSVTGSHELQLEEVEAASEMVRNSVNENANIIFGASFDDTMKDELRVTVIATGFEDVASTGAFTAVATAPVEPEAPAAPAAKTPSANDIDDIFRIFNRR